MKSMNGKEVKSASKPYQHCNFQSEKCTKGILLSEMVCAKFGVCARVRGGQVVASCLVFLYVCAVQ